VSELRDFKFDGQIDHIKSQLRPTDDKQTVREMGVVTSPDQFLMFLERLKLETSNFVHM